MIFRFVFIITGVLFAGGCVRQAPQQGGPLQVFVSIPPQKYFVEKIAGDYCAVTTLIPPGASPHSYEPKPAQMAQLAGTRLYFSIGIEMEQVWLPKIRSINPALTVVATDSGIEKMIMGAPAQDSAPEHNDGPAAADIDKNERGGHGHAGPDPHIWLAPLLVKKQARIIAAALMQSDTAHARIFQGRLTAFEREIDSLHATISRNLAVCGANRSFLVFHPSWGYYAEEFNLHQISIETEGKEPGLRELGNTVRKAREQGVGAVLVQPQFSRALAGTIAKELGIATAVADPLAEDWAGNLMRVTGVLCEK